MKLATLKLPNEVDDDGYEYVSNQMKVANKQASNEGNEQKSTSLETQHDQHNDYDSSQL